MNVGSEGQVTLNYQLTHQVNSYKHIYTSEQSQQYLLFRVCVHGETKRLSSFLMIFCRQAFWRQIWIQPFSEFKELYVLNGLLLKPIIIYYWRPSKQSQRLIDYVLLIFYIYDNKMVTNQRIVMYYLQWTKLLSFGFTLQNYWTNLHVVSFETVLIVFDTV